MLACFWNNKRIAQWGGCYFWDVERRDSLVRSRWRVFWNRHWVSEATLSRTNYDLEVLIMLICFISLHWKCLQKQPDAFNNFVSCGGCPFMWHTSVFTLVYITLYCVGKCVLGLGRWPDDAFGTGPPFVCCALRRFCKIIYLIRISE